MIELVRDLKGYIYPCHISKWSVKIYRRESAYGDFPSAKFENANKNLPKNFGDDYEKKRELI